MKHIFILNSFGKKNPNLIKSRILKYCEDNNMDYKIEINSKEISTKNIIDKYKNQENIIYAVGGDGMINSVLNNIINSKATLSYIPYGTGNDLDRVLKLKRDEYINCNVGKINDKYFINVACFGIDAKIANNDSIVHNSFIPVNQRYNAGILYQLLKYKFRELEICFNDKII